MLSASRSALWSFKVAGSVARRGVSVLDSSSAPMTSPLPMPTVAPLPVTARATVFNMSPLGRPTASATSVPSPPASVTLTFSRLSWTARSPHGRPQRTVDALHAATDDRSRPSAAPPSSAESASESPPAGAAAAPSGSTAAGASAGARSSPAGLSAGPGASPSCAPTGARSSGASAGARSSAAGLSAPPSCAPTGSGAPAPPGAPAPSAAIASASAVTHILPIATLRIRSSSSSSANCASIQPRLLARLVVASAALSVHAA
jgi:hypothetical protein